MKVKIDPRWPEIKLDSFLLENYGFSLIRYRLSATYIYVCYVYSTGCRVQKLIQSRIRKLDKLETIFISQVDKYLEEVDFYTTCLSSTAFMHNSGFSKWPAAGRKEFIKNRFDLTGLLNSLAQMKLLYTKQIASLEITGAFHGIEIPIRIYPFNHLLLVFCQSMKRHSKIDWINIALLFDWFSSNVKEKLLCNFYSLNRAQLPDESTLRLVYNKYRKTPSYSFAKECFEIIFRNNASDEKLSDIDNKYKTAYIGKMPISCKNWMKIIDLYTILHPSEPVPVLTNSEH